MILFLWICSKRNKKVEKPKEDFTCSQEINCNAKRIMNGCFHSVKVSFVCAFFWIGLTRMKENMKMKMIYVHCNRLAHVSKWQTDYKSILLSLLSMREWKMPEMWMLKDVKSSQRYFHLFGSFCDFSVFHFSFLTSTEFSVLISHLLFTKNS